MVAAAARVIDVAPAAIAVAWEFADRSVAHACVVADAAPIAPTVTAEPTAGAAAAFVPAVSLRVVPVEPVSAVPVVEVPGPPPNVAQVTFLVRVTSLPLMALTAVSSAMPVPVTASFTLNVGASAIVMTSPGPSTQTAWAG